MSKCQVWFYLNCNIIWCKVYQKKSWKDCCSGVWKLFCRIEYLKYLYLELNVYADSQIPAILLKYFCLAEQCVANKQQSTHNSVLYSHLCKLLISCWRSQSLDQRWWVSSLHQPGRQTDIYTESACKGRPLGPCKLPTTCRSQPSYTKKDKLHVSISLICNLDQLTVYRTEKCDKF